MEAELFAKVMNLPASDRMALARQLLQSLDADQLDSDPTETWHEAMQRQLAEIRSGSSHGMQELINQQLRGLHEKAR